MPPPTCMVVPGGVDFDTVTVGEYVDTTFVIRNRGGGVLPGTVSVVCDHYSIVSGGGPYSLGAGESTYVVVRFEPDSVGVCECGVSMGSGDCSSVVCTGVGAAVAVRLERFSRSWSGDGVEVEWVLREVGGGEVLGFEVVRVCESTGRRERVEDLEVVRDGDRFVFRDGMVESGERYRYEVSVFEGGELVVSFEVELVIPVTVVALYQNHPNPFNPSTTIMYALPGEGRVVLEVFDITGRRLRTLVDGVRVSGRHREVWDGCDDRGRQVASGVYIYRLQADGKTYSRKCALLR